MFAVFEVKGNDKEQVSGVYGNRTVAYQLRKSMEATMDGRVFIVQQKFKAEGEKRGTWQTPPTLR